MGSPGFVVASGDVGDVGTVVALDVLSICTCCRVSLDKHLKTEKRRQRNAGL